VPKASKVLDDRALTGRRDSVGPVTKKRIVREGKMMMKVLLILVVVCFSAPAFAQTAAPQVGGKPLVQVKPQTPAGCKLVGTVKGTRIWAGDCVANELRGDEQTAPAVASPK
jgi:hypothetical protein